MNEKYSALFTPWKIGNVEIKNRIVQPSMGGTSLFGWLEPCHFDKEAAYHILNRAQNNVGLVLPGMQCVRDTMGGRWLYQNKKMFKDLAEWLPEFHKTGSKLFVQLSAGMGRSMAINEIMVKMLQNKAFGAVGKPFLNVDYITASASATPNRWYPECKSRPLTVEEIHEMVEAFAKTAKLLQDAGVDGVEIRLDKRVPFGAGLGGGSSDGTAVLLALDGLFGLRLSEAELIDLAAGLGSDTAFFVRNTPQLCTGRGEIMEPYPLCLVGMTLVVVKPDVGVSTREAYAGVRPHVPEVPLAERLRRPVVEWQGLVTNDFEPHIFAAHPAIREARDSLLAAGAVYASMSGSGSAVFGLFDDAQKAGNLRLQTPFVYTL